MQKKEMDLTDWIKSVDIRYRLAVVVTFLFGVLSHGIAMFQKFSINDDAVCFFEIGATFQSGRWMLGILAKAEELFFRDGQYSMPLYNSVVSFALLSLTACLIIKLFQVRKQLYCCLIAALMVSIPSITGLYAFQFTMPAYMLALFLATAGVYCIKTYPNWLGFLFGVGLMVCSIGIYQAYIPFLLSLLLLHDVFTVLNGEEDRKTVLKKIITDGAAAVLAFVLYVLADKIILWLLHADITNYRETEITGGGRSVMEYLQAVINAYLYFFVPGQHVRSNMYVDNVLAAYYCFLAVSAVLLVRRLVAVFRKDWFLGVIGGLLIALIPLATNFIHVMVGRHHVYSLMVYAALVPFLLTILLLDNLPHSKDWMIWLKRGTVFLFALVLLTYVRYNNKAYLKTTVVQQESISYATTMITRIKMVPGYQDTMPVALINSEKSFDNTMTLFEEFADMKTVSTRDLRSYIADYSYADFMAIWCGFRPEYADSYLFQSLPEVQSMPSYPADGSIAVINDVVVVKCG